MKKSYKLIAIAAVILSATSCKEFLTITPQDSLVSDNFYTSASALRANTASLYGKVWFDYFGRFMSAAEVAQADFISQSRKEITLALPKDAMSGKLKVVDASENELYSDNELTVLQPAISLKDQTIKAGVLLTIPGTNMSGVAYNEGVNGVRMNDFIYGKAGKYPALTCYDFIFYTHRGDKYASGYTWVDYGALVANAKRWWDNGGIVALMWHWHDPSRTVDNFYTGATADNKVTFDISTALADTNSQNYKNIIADIDTVSRYIGELQSAGIPVIFRPLHEAEGSYRWGACS